MPLGVGSSSISLLYAVDFTALLMVGPGPACLLRWRALVPVHVPHARAESRVQDGLQHGRPRAHRSPGRVLPTDRSAGTHGVVGPAPLQPSDGAAMTYFLVNSLARRSGVRLVDAAPRLQGVARQLPLEHHQLRRRGNRRGHRRRGAAADESLADGARPRAARADLSGPTASISGGSRRSSGAWPSGRSSTVRARRCSRAQFRQRTTTAARHVDRVQYYAATLASQLELPEPGHAGGRDRGVAPRHRKAGRPRTYPVEARAAHAERAEEDADSRSGRRRDRRAPSVFPARSRRSSAAITSAGTARVILPGCTASRFRSAPGSWRSSDCFDALTSERPYRPAVSPDVAIHILAAEAGRAFDPSIVSHFAELVPLLSPAAGQLPAGADKRLLDDGCYSTAGRHSRPAGY